MNSRAADHLVPVDASAWISDFGRALTGEDRDVLRGLFTEDANWRDNMALTWTIGQRWGFESLADGLLDAAGRVDARDLRASSDWHEPGEVVISGEPVIELFLDFETEAGSCLAVVWARRDDDSPYGIRAYNLYTRLVTLAGSPRPVASASGVASEIPHIGIDDAVDPDVLIVGGGHGGSFAAAHLQQLGVDYLIVERNERMGDNWRNRYDRLALHGPARTCTFPFLPFPEDYPQYIPKDMLGDWIEHYADQLGLRYWTSTSFLGATRNDENTTWTARVRRGDGSERVLHPKHIILATGGIGGLPHMPDVPGLDGFRGEVIHSSAFRNGGRWAGKRAVVFGASTSAHDVSLDLHLRGADVTMIQRGPISVADLDTANLSYGDYMSEGYPLEILDVRLAAGRIAPVMKRKAQAYTKMANERDRELLAGLRAAGLRIDDGEDGTGWVGRFAQRGGAYYLNVGASQAIIDGGIKIAHAENVSHVNTDGVVLQDGSALPADVLIFCTGYQNRTAELRLWFDENIANRFDNIAMVGDSGEYANAWIPTAQKGLWFMVGGLMPARVGSPFLAMGVKADLEGRIPDYARALPATAHLTPTL